MKPIMIFFLAMGLTATLPAQRLTSIEITASKTTSIVFPAAIEHADRGSENILIQKVEGTNNILLIKAGRKDFEQTNLSVITADGNLYSFLVNYQNTPQAFAYYPTVEDVAKNTSHSAFQNRIAFTGQLLPSSLIENYAKGILDNPAVIHNIHDQSFGLNAVLAGIYIKDEVLFLHIKIKNNSLLSYDIDMVRLSIKDYRTTKRTASQEKDILPLYTAGNCKTVEPGKETAIVLAVPKFTMPEKQKMAVEMLEQNGGRQLSMKVNNRKITRAKQLPAYE